MIKDTNNIFIGDLISHHSPFMVPMYQRAYAWESGEGEEVADFIGDLRQLIQARTAIVPESMRQFFGGVVCINKFKSTTEPGYVLEIVDGQQRLATFFMTLHLISRALDQVSSSAGAIGDADIEAKAKFYAQQTERQYIRYEDMVPGSGSVERLKIRLSKADQMFFEGLINGSSPTADRQSHHRLLAAMTKLQADLILPMVGSGSTPEKRLRDLMALRACITEDCHVVHIVSNEPREAYRLFSILNDRGKSLSDGDLMRTHSMQMLEGHENHQYQVEKHWESILAGTLSETDKFLRAYYASRVGKRPPRRDLYDSFRREFFDSTSVPVSKTKATDVERTIGAMNSDLVTYGKLRAGEWPYPSTLSATATWDQNRLGRLINVLKHDLCLPLLLSAHNAWGKDEARFAALVHLLERFAFRYITVVRARVSSLEERYYTHAKTLRSAPATYDMRTLEADLKVLLARDADDAVFQIGLDNLNYAESSNRRIIKHLLTTLEDHYTWLSKGARGKLRPDKSRVFDMGLNSIEHIYPQNALASDIDTELEEVKQRLGNLSFWAFEPNVAAANSNFLAKKAAYATSHVMMNRELTGLPSWDKAAFEARHSKIKEWALKVFSL